MKGRKGRAVEERGGESHYQSDKGERKQGSTVVWRGSRPTADRGRGANCATAVPFFVMSSLAPAPLARSPGLLLALGQHPLS